MKKNPKAQPQLFEDPAAKQVAIENRRTQRDRRALVPHKIVLPEPTTLYEAILRAAANPKIDANKLKVLTEVQIEVENRDAKKAFTRAFNALQAELPTITKDGLIDHGEGVTARGNKKIKAKYSTYPNLMSVCRPLLKKHGFTFNNVIEPSADGSRITVVGYLTHVEGHFMSSSFPIGRDDGPGRSLAQAWGSASSYGKRYNLILLCDIVSESPGDQDDDARKSNDPRIQREVDPDAKSLSTAQLIELNNAITDCGVGLAKFLASNSIERVEDLEPAKFKEALTACANYKMKRDAKHAQQQHS